MKMIFGIAILMAILAIFAIIFYSDDINKATYRGDYDKVKYFVEKGIDLNPASQKSPLQVIANANMRVPHEEYAPEGSLCKIAELLIANGADVNFQDNGYGAPLLIAARSRHYDLIKLLLKYSVDVNVENEFGETPLFTMCFYENDESIEIIKLLINNGADVNKSDEDGWPPLFNAIYMRNFKIISLLNENGVCWDVKDNRGRGPLEIAEARYSGILLIQK